MVGSWVGWGWARGWAADRICLVTGADKADAFWQDYTQLTITTYGMMWHWITKDDGRGMRDLLWRHTAFLLDELAGAPGEQTVSVTTDPQFSEVADCVPQVCHGNPCR